MDRTPENNRDESATDGVIRGTFKFWNDGRVEVFLRNERRWFPLEDIAVGVGHNQFETGATD